MTFFYLKIFRIFRANFIRSLQHMNSDFGCFLRVHWVTVARIHIFKYTVSKIKHNQSPKGKRWSSVPLPCVGIYSPVPSGAAARKGGQRRERKRRKGEFRCPRLGHHFSYAPLTLQLTGINRELRSKFRG